jgi:hypothetical protein
MGERFFRIWDLAGVDTPAQLGTGWSGDPPHILDSVVVEHGYVAGSRTTGLLAVLSGNPFAPGVDRHFLLAWAVAASAVELQLDSDDMQNLIFGSPQTWEASVKADGRTFSAERLKLGADIFLTMSLDQIVVAVLTRQDFGTIELVDQTQRWWLEAAQQGASVCCPGKSIPPGRRGSLPEALGMEH